MFESRPRIIPSLLMHDEGLYKTRRFKKPVYVGDPVNTVRIFNNKEVDELILLDIGAARKSKPINFDKLQEIASECFVPLSYGGGIRDIQAARRLLSIGIERLIINTVFYDKSSFATALVREFGASSVIGSVDVGVRHGRRRVYVAAGTKLIAAEPIDWCLRIEDLGVGEIMINAIDRDGELCGYDLDFIEQVCARVSIPVIASGGARSIDDFRAARLAGAQAMSAGAMFFFRGPHRGVLLQYTNPDYVFGEL